MSETDDQAAVATERTLAAPVEQGQPLDVTDVPGGNGLTEVRVELVAVDGGTHMVMTHVGIPAGSPGEAGWAMAIDKLDQVV